MSEKRAEASSLQPGLRGTRDRLKQMVHPVERQTRPVNAFSGFGTDTVPVTR